MEIFAIGFTKKNAGEFFGLLKKHGIRRLVDVRLNDVFQLAGFAKRDDLRYFLKEPLLAPIRRCSTPIRRRREAGTSMRNCS